MVLTNNNKGQTSVEYLLLTAVAFMVAYIIATGPLANFTKELLSDIHDGLGNVVEHAEWTRDNIEPGKGKHPGNPERLRPVHL